MKLNKFKSLLSISVITLTIAPFTSFTINATNYATVKINILNNNVQDTSVSSNPLVAPTTVDTSTLAPNGNDLYNEYNFESGYVIKSVKDHTISFYDWFKQKKWCLDVSTVITSIGGQTPTNILDTMNIKAALTSSGAYDTKLFVYGNLKDISSNNITGSYVFQVVMATGKVVDKSIIENTTQKANMNNSTILISDIRQLTVINQNTIIVSSNISNDANNNTHSFSISILTLDGATINIQTLTSSINNTNITSNVVLGAILGVIKKDNQYVFAMSASNINSESTFDLSVYYWYFTLSNNNLNLTNFSETAPMSSLATSQSYDFQTIISSINKSEISSDNSQQVTDIQNWLENNCANFSVVYPATATNPKMLVSYNWDTTDTNPDVKAIDFAKNKVTLVAFSNDTKANKDRVQFGIYKMPDNVGTNTPLLGISNLIYTHTKKDDGSFIQPYAVIVGQNTFNNSPTIVFNLVKLDTTTSDNAVFNAALSNTSATASGTTIDGNVVNSSFTTNNTGYFVTNDAYTTDKKAVSSSNIKKMDWQLQFIPNNGTASSGTSIDTYYAYISTGIENDNKAVDYQQNFISIPAIGTSSTFVTNLNLNDYQFGITDNQLSSIYRPLNENDSKISSKSFATQTTKNALIADLQQAYAYTALYDPDSNSATVLQESWQQISNVTYDPIILSVNETDGTISGSITYQVKNWWNNQSSKIVRTINLQLSKPADFSIADLASSLTEGTDKTVQDWLQAKYSFEGLFLQNQSIVSDQLVSFVKDILSNAYLGNISDNKTLRSILLNSLPKIESSQYNSVYLQVDSNADNTGTTIRIGEYIIATFDTINKTVTITFDLSSASGLDSTSPATIQFQNFSGKYSQTSTFPNYDVWSQHQSPAEVQEEQHQEEEQQKDNPSGANNNSFKNNNLISWWAIAVIIIAAIVVIALIIGIYFFVKKKKNTIIKK
ncbi:MAG: hypothetical protein HUJ42_03700 [Malacoplasma sp.]|nr:hypothetical protein [Malacoplasma sp.]